VILYDTDSLFAASSRLDLVGHNYNRGWYAWEGVFVNLNKFKPGDKIVLFTKDGGKHDYFVKKVVEIPWVAKTAAELNKHLSYLGPTGDERVTLVTCGGSFGVWSARVYVVAK
jgi:sortase (surface protein transpeptidase)